MTDLKVAVVGAGYMAREHIAAFRDVPRTRIAGIHSRTDARAEALAAEFEVPIVTKSITELYERTRAELVVITVPELFVNSVSKECFAFPWTVLIEKPAGLHLSEAAEICSAADERKCHAFVALNRRHYGSTKTVLDDLTRRSGRRLIVIQDQEDPARALAAGQPKAVVDNWMYANSIHLIDYFTFLGRGNIDAVESIVPWNAEEPRYVAAKISFDSGDVGLYQAVWCGPGPWSVTINADEIRCELRPLERAAFQLSGARTLESTANDEWDARFKPGLRRQAELAVAAARGERTELPTLGDGLRTMQLIRSIYGIAD